MGHPLLSIILCTVARYEEVRRFLSSLPDNDYSELVVVDQNQDDRVLELCRESGHQHIYLKQQVAALSRARNLGLEHAKGELVFFADDDSELPHDFLSHVEAAWKRHPAADLIAGVTVDAESGDASVCKFPFDRPVRITFRNVWYTFTIGAGVFRRSVFEEGALFDEDFGLNSKYKSGEDLDFVLRLLSKRKLLFFDPEIQVFHPHTTREWTRSSAKRMYAHGMGLGAAIRKNLEWASSIFSLSFLASRLFRPLAAAIVFSAIQPEKSRCYLAYFRGRLSGFLAYDKNGGKRGN